MPKKNIFWARFTLSLNEWRERIMTVYWMNRYSRRLYRCFYFDEKYLKILFTISIVSRHRYSYIHYYNIMKHKSSSRVDELIFSQRTCNSFKNKMFNNSSSMRKRRKRSRLIMSILQSAGNNLITLNAVWNECSLTHSLAWWCGECLTWPYKTYL